MIIPLDELIKTEENIYEVTCAAIRRAYQISVTGDEDLEQNQGKVVSTAIRQVLTGKVEYRIEE
jgi:DNA-directed RNA polymerase subunit omega